MAIVVNKMPSGRGIRRGEDWYVNQGEAYRFRVGQIPTVGRDILSPIVPGAEATVYMAFGTTATQFFYVGAVSEAMTYKEVRGYFDTASKTLGVALYYYDEKTRTLKQVPKSSVQVPTATGGIGRVSVDIQVLPTKRLFLAVGNTSGSSITIGTARTSYNYLSTVYVADNGALAGTYPEAELIKATVRVPSIAYVSQFIKDVL